MDSLTLFKMFCLISSVFAMKARKQDVSLIPIDVNCDLKKFVGEKLDQFIDSTAKNCNNERLMASCDCQNETEKVIVASIYMNLSDNLEGSTEMEEDNVDSVISWINFPGKINRAMRKFNKLPNKSRFVKRIVKESLENPENFDFVLEFVKSLSELSNKFIAASTIFDEYVEQQGHKNSQKLLKMFQDIIKDDNFDEFSKIDQKYLIFMKNDIRNYEIMTNRVQLIEYYYELKPLKSNVATNFYKILNVSVNFCNNQSGFHKYPENEAFLIKATEEVPVAIQLLTSGECVSMITSSYYFFHAKNDSQATGTSIYSGTANQQEGEKWKWTLEIEKSSDKFYFYIKNIDTDQYMYATNDKNPSNAALRILSISPEKKNLDTFKWMLDPRESGNYFYLTNLQFKEGLFLDTNSKKIFTQSGAGQQIIIRGC